MPRHDYDLPPDWDAMSDEEKCEWMTLQRDWKRAMAQDTTWGNAVKQHQERMERMMNYRDFQKIG